MFQLSGERDAAQISVKYLEQKVSLLERSNVANRDTLLRGVQERHEMEMIGLRSQIQNPLQQSLMLSSGVHSDA
jgi:hypothetical protein